MTSEQSRQSQIEERAKFLHDETIPYWASVGVALFRQQAQADVEWFEKHGWVYQGEKK